MERREPLAAARRQDADQVHDRSGVLDGGDYRRLVGDRAGLRRRPRRQWRPVGAAGDHAHPSPLGDERRHQVATDKARAAEDGDESLGHWSPASPMLLSA